jgi:dihydrodipicolinate synthase/N-acetylneuraminate lyase
MSKVLSGVIPIIATPLTKDETLDASALKRVINYVVDAGVHGVWVLGSAGELPNLPWGERRKVMDAAVEIVNGRVPVVVGVGSPGTKLAIAGAQEAAKAGADYVNVVPPYYYPYSEEQSRRHYEIILDNIDLPLAIYRRGANPIGLETMKKLCAHPKVVAIKDVPTEFRLFQRMVAELGPMNVSVLTAAGRLIHPAVAVGGDGVVCVEAAIAPKLCVEIYEAAGGGRNEEAARLQQKLYRLSNIVQVPPNHVTGLPKAALSLLGLCDDVVTAPFAPVPDSTKKELKAAMKDLGLL